MSVPLACPFSRLAALLGWVIASGILTTARAQSIPAFPGAEGYGAYAKGGRGGDVYHVTNLNASGTGSFADAIATVPSAGRTIVFDVSGYIRLPSGSNGTRMTTSKVTIAGQTAPGDGIGFYNNFFRISGDDVVLRHLRFRHGKYGSGGDCIDLDSGSLNSMLDHISMQFSTDENMSSFGSPPENLTLQYSLNAWGLESHSCGGLWDQNHATSHHNLWAHNHTRNPKARPNGLLEWINNVTFDWDIGFIMGDTQSNQNYKSNVINNYFIGPAGNTHSKALVKGTVGDNGKPNFTVFLSANLIDLNGDGAVNGSDNGYGIVEGTPYAPGTSGLTPGAAGYYQSPGAIVGSPVPAVAVATDSALLAYKKIVSNAGALRLDAGYTGLLRDEVDSRLIAYLVALKAKHITGESSLVAADATVGGFPVSNSGFGTLASLAAPTDTDRDGMPDTYEAALGWTPTVQDHNSALVSSGGIITGTTFLPPNTPAGYTRLEEYLHFLAIPHGRVAKNLAGSPTSITVDLRKFTSGFATSPSFGVGAVVNGTFEQFLANGTTVSATGPIIKFTPTQGFFGRARFDFTVTEAGQSWTQTFAIVVTNEGVPRDLVWLGDGTTNAWNTTSNNWVKSGSATAFSSGDTALFNDLGSNSPTIAVSGTLTAASVTVDSTKNYVLGGTGSTLAGGPLTKGGTGSLTLTNTGIAFTGGVISGGMVGLGTDSATTTQQNAAAFGTAAVSVSNAELRFGGKGGSLATFNIANNFTLDSGRITAADGRQNLNGTVAINGGGATLLTQYATKNLWVQGVMSGSAPLAVDDIALGGSTSVGTVFFSVANTYSGVLTVNASSTGFAGGQISVNHASALSNATINNLSNRAGGGILFDATITTPAFGALSGNGSFALPTGTLTVGGNNASTDFSGALSGTGGLAKTGSGTLTLYSASGYTGATAVSAGTLLVDNSLGNTAVTVSSGALLGGSGTINGTVTANSGSFLSPGTAPFTGATMTMSNGLTIGTATVYCDMQEAVLPALGTNDKIAVTSGPLTYNGAPTFQFLLLKGTLAGGNYDLITAPSSAFNVGVPTTFAHNLPSGTRQDFTVKRSGSAETPAYIRLEVVGDPATLTWSGSVSNVWQVDTSGTPNGWTGGSPTKPNFFNLDAVAFDDTAPSPAVTITGLVQPRAIIVNNSSAKNYTFSGNGAIAGDGTLTKSGSGTLTITLPASVGVASTNSADSTSVTVTDATGLAVGMFVTGNGIPSGTTITVVNGTTLTLSQAVSAQNTGATFTYSWRNTFSGGTTIGAGSTIILGNDMANLFGLGTGAITFNGGTLTLAGFGDSAGANIHRSPLPNALVVPAGATGTLNLPVRCMESIANNSTYPALTGALTGGGTLNLAIKFIRADVQGNWSNFTGTINVLAADADGGDFRFGTSFSYPGFPNATLILPNKITAMYVGIVDDGAGTTIEIGELAGASLSKLSGGPTGGRNFTYRIGSKTPALSEVIFSGTIAEQNSSTATSFVKTGAGIWTLSGTCSWNGGTTVEAGTLKISGSVTTSTAANVAAGATLALAGGTLSTDGLNIANGANFSASGNATLTGDLNNDGTATITSGTFSVSGDVVNNNTMRFTGGAALNATGHFVNNGTIDLLTGAQGLPADFENNGVVIDSSSLSGVHASKASNVVTLTVKGYLQHAYQLQRSDSLVTPTWTNVGSVQNPTANDQTLTFTDSAATDVLRFYRIVVTP